MPQVNLVVDDEDKQKWEDAVQNNAKYESLSHLIRLSVQYELEDTDDSPEVEIDLDPIQQSTNQIQNRLAGLEQQMRELREVVTSELHDDELITQIYEVLPRFEQFGKFQDVVLEADSQEQFDYLKNYENREERAKTYGWVKDIHEAIDAPSSDINHAITVLERSVDEVEVFEYAKLDDDLPWKFVFINEEKTNE